jgi:PRTRC genetic system ThiF family protein
MAKTLEKVYGYCLDDYELTTLNKIVIIGCGGNGSHIVSDIVRLVGTIGRPIEIVLVDGDKVEEKNLIRQHFAEADLGRNKAEVLAGRYGNAYNVPVGFVPEFLTEANKSSIIRGMGRPGVFITCTDNLKSRKIVSEQVGHVWIDLGNEEFGGQVTFSSLYGPSFGTKIVDGEAFLTPHVFELFDEYTAKAKEEGDINERSCAEVAAESPNQAGYVNVTCAAIAKNYVHALLTQRPIKNYQTFFTIDNTFESRSITQSAIEEWINKFHRFRKLTLDKPQQRK